jgi:Co/Zn/Cd efflux system component
MCRRLEAIPKGVDLAAIRAHILAVAHVHEIQDVHASMVATDLPVLTAHQFEPATHVAHEQAAHA